MGLMTHEELLAAAADIQRALAERVHIWRVIVEPGPDGKPRETGEKFYVGSIAVHAFGEPTSTYRGV